MYSEWSSLVNEIREESSLTNVLNAYPTHSSKDVVNIILKSLTDTPKAKDLPVSLTTHNQVKWTMDVIGHGLALPLSEHNLMHLCVDVYDGWLSSIYEPKKSVPKPVKENHDDYVPIIFKQLCQVFAQRQDTLSHSTNPSVIVQLENQAILCKRILHILHNAIVHPATRMARETWDCLLCCLLRVSNIILAPPAESLSLATNLKATPVHVLFEAWLRASIHSFPRPQLWKSLYELCSQWRHHRCLANQWTRLVYTLTYHVISHLYTMNFLKDIVPSSHRLDDNFKHIIAEMPYDVLVQCWYRMLHTLGNPVELSYPRIITNSPAFQKYFTDREGGGEINRSKSQSSTTSSANPGGGGAAADLGVDGNLLPLIYHELMRGVATLVYLFLGQDVYWQGWSEGEGVGVELRRGSNLKLPPAASIQGGGTKSKKTSHWYINPLTIPGAVPKTPPPSSPSPRSSSHTNTDILNILMDVVKPKGNTLLHLFGKWLFQAAIWPNDNEDMTRKRSHSSATLDPAHPQSSTPQISREPVSFLRYEKGRAEAFGALCSIFSSQPCGEPFLPVYLARFYHALILGLAYSPEISHGHILTEIILHSSGLLRKDLMGINLVVPYFLDALELILPCLAPQFKWVVNLSELRQASIDLLLSLLSLPLHFLHQPLPNVFSAIPHLQASLPPMRYMGGSKRRVGSADHHIGITHQYHHDNREAQDKKTPPTFYSLKDHLVGLIINGILNEKEKEHINKQLLLHALNVLILDIVTYETALSKSEESSEDGEVSSILREHTHISHTRSNASTHSLFQPNPSSPSEYTPSMLVNKAIYICKTCLFPEAEAGDAPVQVSLAALELLSSLAQLNFENFNHTDSRQAVQLVTSYIESQAMKGQPRHNRDLHTSIVAAFSTLLVWIHAHPYLLGTKLSLASVMKVIELGISGRFSTELDGSTIYKGLKKSRPISGRVKEIAEFMLYLLMEDISSFPSPCGAESSSSLLCEEDILMRLPQDRKEDARFQYFLLDNSILMGVLEEPFPSSHDGEGEGEGESEEVLPTLTAVIRSPSGRHVWSMQMCHHPRTSQPGTDHQHSASRPIPVLPTPVPNSSVKRKPWPDEVNMEPPMKVDNSIPLLLDDVLDDTIRPFHERIFQLTSQQVEIENKIHKELDDAFDSLPYPNPKTAMEPPQIKERDKFNTSRLFLAHLALLGIEGVKEMPTSHYQPLCILNSSQPGFSSTLASLDRLPSRFCNTGFVLYVKEGVTKPEEILSSQSTLSSKPLEFIEFLHGLGWIVDPSTHPGFSGKIRPLKTEDSTNPVGISAQIPSRPFPYFTDAMTELAFVRPTLRPSSADSSASLRSIESSDSGQDHPSAAVPSMLSATHSHTTTTTTQPPPVSSLLQLPPQPPQAYPHGFPPPDQTSSPSSSSSAKTSMYMNIDALPTKESHSSLGVGGGTSETSVNNDGFSTYPGLSRTKKHSRTELGGGGGSDTPRRRWAMPQDCAAMIVWLEKFEDHIVFPADVLSGVLHSASFSGYGSHKIPQGVRRELPVIFIHRMSSGLYQILTKNSGGRPDTMAGPLTDGMVVSRRTLSILVRQTVVNMCSRHRMENDGFSPPHVKRKRKLEEMASAYKLPLTVAEFYTKLITS